MNRALLCCLLLFALLPQAGVAAIVAWYPLDEPLWNGSAGEIRDASGNGHHGQAVGRANTTGNGKVCGGGFVPANTSQAVRDAIDTGVDLDDQVGVVGSISFWFRPQLSWQSRHRRLFDASLPINGHPGVDKYFLLELQQNGQLWFRLEDNRDLDYGVKSRILQGNAWHHIAVTWDMPRNRLQIYIDGTLDASAHITSNGTLGQLDTLFFGDTHSVYPNLGDYNGANGVFDEIIIRNHVASPAQIAADIGASHACPPLQPIVEYRFDECSYSGLPGEIEDHQGNYPATPYHGVDSNRPGVINRFLDLNQRRHQARTVRPVPMNHAWTLSAWFRLPFATRKGRMVLAAMEGGGDLLYLKRSNLRWGVYAQGRRRLGNFSFSTLGNGWHHLVLVGTNQGASGHTDLYIDGALVDGIDLQARGDLRYIGTDFNRADRDKARGFGTALDEFMIFNRILSPSEIQTIYSNQLNGLNLDGSTRPAVSCQLIDHFNIQVGAGNASTCSPFSFSITAEDSANNPVASYEGSIRIATSSGHGNFATANATNPLVPSPDNDDNGSVDYTFDSADNGQIDLTLADEHAETLTLQVTDSAIPLTATSASIHFRDNAFEIIDTDTQVAGDDVPVAGRDHAYRIRLLRKDPSTGACGLATGYDGNHGLRLWRSRNAADPGGLAPSLAATPLPDAEPSTDNASIQFHAGEADVILATADIGKYRLEVKDASRNFAGVDIAGSSAQQIVRPFGIGIDFSNLRDADFADNGSIDDSTGSDLSYAADASGSVFTQAGEDFPMTVAGVLWQAVDDADKDGVPDNGAYLGDNPAAPSFGDEGEVVIAVPSVNRPAGASLAALVVNGLAGGRFAAFSNGAQTAPVSYGNVGIIDIQARLEDNDYFGSGVALAGTAPNVGRFNPWQYAVSASNVSSACNVSTAFTYAREPFEASLTLQAQNKNGTLTDGYRGAFVTLDIPTELNLHNDQTGLAYDLESYSINEDFGSGTHGQADFDVQLAWNMPLQAPTDSSVELIDTSDEVTRIGGSPFAVGQTEIRFGRMALGNSHGSELMSLPVPMRAEYYDGASFLLNADDGCSSFNASQLRLDSAVESAQTDGDIQVLPGQTTRLSLANAPLLAGDAGLSLCPPGNPACTPTPGNEGWVDLRLDLGLRPWLRFDWDGDGTHDNDPTARATFGIYRGNDRQIHLRRLFD